MAEEIFSLVATGIQLLEFASSVISNCFCYYKEVRDARQEVTRIRDEVYGLLKIIEELQGVLEEHDPSSRRPTNSQSIQDEFDQTRTLLEDAEKLTKPRETEGVRAFKWPFRRNDTIKLLKRIETRKANLTLVLQGLSQSQLVNISRDVSDIRQNVEDSKQKELRNDMDKLLDWLCPDEISPHKDQANLKALRTKGTGIWIRDQPDYRKWKEQHKFLWICGLRRILVCLVLTYSWNRSSLIDHVCDNPDGHILTWFYCDGRSENPTRRLRYLLGSIYRQILEAIDDDKRLAEIVNHVQLLRNEERKSAKNEIGALFVNNIAELCKSLGQSIYIFVDGIDESHDAEEICQRLLQLGQICWIHRIVVSSRPEKDIEKWLQKQLRLEITEEMNLPDLERHIDHCLETHKKLERIGTEEKIRIKRELLNERRRRFSYAHCMLNEIARADRSSARWKALRSFPRGHEELYKRILDRLGRSSSDGDDGNDTRTLALRVLAWLLYGSVPLNLALLASAASISPNEAFTEDQRVDDDTCILEACRSLIYVQPTTNIIAVCHCSVSQFLQSPTMPDGKRNDYYLDVHESHALLMRACFMYLRSPWFSTPILSTLSISEMGPKLSLKFRDRFIFYAIWNWVDHAKYINEDQSYWSSVHEFLTGDSLGVWSELWEIETLRRHTWWDESKEDISRDRILCEIASAGPGRSQVGGPLYYACRLGLPSIVKRCLESEDPNAFGGPMSYPLFAALSNGHMDVADLLLKHGANINQQVQPEGNTALHNAISEGDFAAVKFLRERNANLTICNERGDAPIHVAIRKASERSIPIELVQQLLHQPGVVGPEGKTPLHLSVSLNFEPLVSLLLEHDADLNALDNDNRTPFHTFAALGKAADLMNCEGRAPTPKGKIKWVTHHSI